MRPSPFRRLSDCGRLATAFYCRHIEGWSSPSREGQIMGMCGAQSWRRASRGDAVGGISTHGRRDHHGRMRATRCTDSVYCGCKSRQWLPGHWMEGRKESEGDRDGVWRVGVREWPLEASYQAGMSGFHSAACQGPVAVKAVLRSNATRLLAQGHQARIGLDISRVKVG